MANLTQMNVSVSPNFVEEVDTLAKKYGWSKRNTVETAIRTLAQVMAAHEAYADQHDDDIGDVYMRLAAEMPAGFLEVPKDGVRVGRAAGMPAVMIDDAWLIWSDPASGNLFAEEQGGSRRVGVVTDGEIKPLKVPSPEEVALN